MLNLCLHFNQSQLICAYKCCAYKESVFAQIILQILLLVLMRIAGENERNILIK